MAFIVSELFLTYIETHIVCIIDATIALFRFQRNNAIASKPLHWNGWFFRCLITALVTWSLKLREGRKFRRRMQVLLEIVFYLSLCWHSIEMELCLSVYVSILFFMYTTLSFCSLEKEYLWLYSCKNTCTHGIYYSFIAIFGL